MGASRGLRAGISRRARAAVVVLAAPVVACASAPASAPVNGVDAARVGTPVRPGQSAYGNYLAARHAGFARELDRAADLLISALEQDPDAPSVMALTHRVLLAQGRVDEAVDIARRLTSLGSTGPFATLTLALSDIRENRLPQAAARASDDGSTGANRVLNPVIRAWALAGQGKTDAALDALEPLAGVRGFGGLRDLHRALVLDLGERGADADAAYGMLAERMARPAARLVEVIANFHERAGAPDKARALYRRYRTSQPDSLLFEAKLAATDPGQPPRLVATAADGVAEALFHFAGALNDRNATDAALVYIRLALYLRRDFPAARMMLADLLETLRRFADANDVYAGIGAESEFRWSARIRAAENLHELDRTDEALAALAALGDERPRRIDALSRLGSILRAEERYDEAVEIYDRIMARVGAVERHHWPLLYARGVALERTKRWKRAEADFLRALELEPDQPLVLNYLGYSWADQGVRLDEARKMIERAVEQRPNDGYIVDSLGWVLHRVGKFSEAVVHLERAVELQPGDPIINDHLGDAYWGVGRYYEARFQWQRSLSLNPEPALARQLAEKLARAVPKRARPATKSDQGVTSGHGAAAEDGGGG